MSRLVNYGPGEVVDRLSILAQKLAHEQGRSTEELAAFRDESNRLLDDSRLQHCPIWMVASLSATNGELWGHEDQIRKVRTSPRDYYADDVAKVAIEIQELNDRRASLVAAINEAVKSIEKALND